jgi:hypothetical protein
MEQTCIYPKQDKPEQLVQQYKSNNFTATVITRRETTTLRNNNDISIVTMLQWISVISGTGAVICTAVVLARFNDRL